MKKLHSVPGLVFLLFLTFGVCSVSFALEVPLFSPLRYSIDDAQGTAVYTDTVTMGNVVSGEFHLIVQNGSGGANKVSLAEVYIGGKRLVKLTSKSKKDLIDKKVKLTQDSEMQIKLTGPIDSFVVVSVIAKKLTRVPFVIRMAQADAQAAMTAALLKIKKKPAYASHGYLPTGSVMSQTPQAGVYVKEKTKATITVSTGPDKSYDLLPGEASALASGAVTDYNIDDRVMPTEIETVGPSGVKVARSKLLIAFTPDATVGQINNLLTSIHGTITAMLKGVNQVIVRLSPAPASLSELDTLIDTYLTGNPIVRYVEKATMPVASALPPPLDPTDAYFDHITHHLDVRAHAAWNARSLIRNKLSPFIIMADYFGEGPPISDFAVTPLNIADFKTGDPDADGHGYHVLGIIAASYGGDSWRDSTTGMYPGSGTDVLTLSAVDVQWGYSGFDMRQKLMERLEPLRTFHRVGVILNTSMGSTCVSGDKSCIEPIALAWLEQVRGPTLWPTGQSGLESLENRFLHVTAAGNVSAPGDTDAVLESGWTAARLLSPLNVPETGNSLANLTNTLVIESRDRSPVLLGGTPGCLRATSKFPGDLAAVGEDVFSLTGPQYNAGPLSGTSMATPQVTGLAAYMWTIKPGLTPQGIMDILVTTADSTSCGGLQSAPVIDAYAAVLALDNGYPDMEVRRAILDLNGDRFFNEKDVEKFLAEFEAANGAKDYSRYDLNGDGLTGSESKAKFNLNMDYAPHYGTVYQFIEGNSVSFVENSLSDLDILCYYAYSRLYTGDTEKRKDLLSEKCTGEAPPPPPPSGSARLKVSPLATLFLWSNSGNPLSSGPSKTVTSGPIYLSTDLLTIDAAGSAYYNCSEDPDYYNWSVHGEVQSAATAQYGLLSTLNFVSAIEQNDAPCPGAPETADGTAYTVVEFQDDWTITADSWISGTGTLILDLESNGTGTNYDAGHWASAGSISTVHGWAILPGKGSYTLSKTFQFGEEFTVGFRLIDFAASRSSDNPFHPPTVITTNTFALVGMRVLDGKGVEITKFKLNTSSKHDYGFGNH